MSGDLVSYNRGVSHQTPNAEDERRGLEFEALLREDFESPTNAEVYADWLEERGDRDRARLVRLHLAEERGHNDARRSAHELVAQNWTRWFGSARIERSALGWRRGFVRDIRLGSWWNDAAERRGLLSRPVMRLLRAVRTDDVISFDAPFDGVMDGL